MRIAYSCAGEGLGHAARTTALGPLLEKRHELVYYLPHSLRDFFRARLGERQFRSIPLIAFKKRGEQVRLIASIVSALPLLLLFPYEVLRLALSLRSWKADAVISDFDPYLAWAGRLAGLPVLQINHPGIVQRSPVPSFRAALTALASRVLEGPWDERIHISFFGGDAGPIVRPAIFRYPAEDRGFVLLNLKHCLRPRVLPILDGLGLPYRLFPSPGEDFEAALAACSCVLSTAGHQMIVESLALDKPILVIPQGHQWEQQLNALMLERTGKGAVANVEGLERELPLFLARIEDYRRAQLPRQFTVADSSRELVARIERFVELRARRRGPISLLPAAGPARSPQRALGCRPSLADSIDHIA